MCTTTGTQNELKSSIWKEKQKQKRKRKKKRVEEISQDERENKKGRKKKIMKEMKRKKLASCRNLSFDKRATRDSMEHLLRKENAWSCD